MSEPVLKKATSPILQNGEGDSTDKMLAALDTLFSRALLCCLNKIIEPNLSGEFRDRLRREILMLSGVRRTARILLSKPESEERRTIANNLSGLHRAWVADGGLRWLGDLSDLDRPHFSPHQH